MPYNEVFTKFKAGKLRSGGSGKPVTDRKQAVAIYLSEKRASKTKPEYRAAVGRRVTRAR